MIAGWRLYAAIALLALAAGAALWVGVTWSQLERRAAEATHRAETAEAAATRNAEAVTEAARVHAAEMAAVAGRAAAAETERQALETQLEALRAAPSHSTPVAPVLDLAVDQLRTRRDGAGGPADPPGAPGAAAGPTGPAGAATAGRPPEPGPHR